MRYLIAAAAGSGVTLMLFLLMHTLISGEQGFDAARLDGGLVEFIRVNQEEITQLKERVPPEEPPPPEDPPRPPRLQVSDQSKPPQAPPAIDMPRVSIAVGTGNGPYIGPWSPGDIASEGDVIPVVRIDPQWPREALLEGIEGWVEVEFTVLPDGSVANARVVDSEPRRVFDRSALRAILRWKFKPRIVDGQPVSRQATQRIDFELDQ